MCGRYTLVTKVKALEKKFNLTGNITFEPNTNISTGEFAPVIANDFPDQIQLFQFGFTPYWSEKRTYVINARSEGDKNKDNNPLYSGSKDIIFKPMFRQSIRSKRCLVPADCFIEGPATTRLNNPFVVYLKEGIRPFMFAGIWDEWVDKSTGELIKSFAIITTVANDLLNQIGHHRSPVILRPEETSMWLDTQLPLNEALQLLNPYPSNEMNAYPISNKIKSPKSNGTDLLEPIGQRLNKEFDYVVYDELKLEGMGSTPARARRNNEGQQTYLF